MHVVSKCIEIYHFYACCCLAYLLAFRSVSSTLMSTIRNKPSRSFEIMKKRAASAALVG